MIMSTDTVFYISNQKKNDKTLGDLDINRQEFL